RQDPEERAVAGQHEALLALPPAANRPRALLVGRGLEPDTAAIPAQPGAGMGKADRRAIALPELAPPVGQPRRARRRQPSLLEPGPQDEGLPGVAQSGQRRRVEPAPGV